MIAGSVAGMVEHMAMFPVDTIKTQMQAIGSCPIKSISIRQAFRSIVQTEGIAGLYLGIGAMALGAGPAHAVYFSVYENFGNMVLLLCPPGWLSQFESTISVGLGPWIQYFASVCYELIVLRHLV
nr:mitoferrin-1-like [Nicotiana tomentosiformis]